MSDAYQHLFVPAGNPDAPTLLLLHGTGGNERDLLPLARAISPGSAVLSPRGNVNENGQLRFFRRFSEGVFDLEDVERRTIALADFVSEAAKKYRFDGNELIALGFSNGANIAGTLLQLRPETLHAAILFRAMIVLESEPVEQSLTGKHVLMSNGTEDPIISRSQSAGLAQKFRKAGAEVEFREQATGHGLVSADISLAREWMARLYPSPL